MKGAALWQNSLVTINGEHFWGLLSNLMTEVNLLSDKAKEDLLSDLLRGSFYGRPFAKPV